MEMKRIGLVLILSVTILLTIVPAYAMEGNEKEFYRATITSDAVTVTGVTLIPSDAPKRVKATWTMTVEDIVLEIGSYSLTPDGYSAEGLSMRPFSDVDAVIVKVKETYTFDDLGTIEITINGKIYNYGTPEQYDVSTVKGWGTDYFKGVKISAIGYGDNTNVKVHIGTIMGWPGLPA